MAGRNMKADLDLAFELQVEEALTASLIGDEQGITQNATDFQTLELLKKLQQQTQEKRREGKAKTASFVDVDYDSVIDIDDDCVILLGNNERKGRKRPREDDADDDCVIIDGNTKQRNGVVVDVERLNKEKAARTASVDDYVPKKLIKDSSIQPQPRETQLDSRVANFISLICSRTMIEQQRIGIGYNAGKLPLGKLSKSTIMEHYFEQENLLYTHYNRLRCELKAIDIGSKEYSMIEKYIKNTSSNYTVDIVQLFTVSKKSEDERFRKFSNTKNRMLLWHGSRLNNWSEILSEGLCIPRASLTGYAPGRGVYFADMFSKSAQYCHPYESSSTGVLLLCEVALGEMAELNIQRPGAYTASMLPTGTLSLKAVGSTAPDPAESQTLDDGVIVPLGKPKNQRGGMSYSLSQNEYVVYNADQIRMRYLIHVNFNNGTYKTVISIQNSSVKRTSLFSRW